MALQHRENRDRVKRHTKRTQYFYHAGSDTVKILPGALTDLDDLMDALDEALKSWSLCSVKAARAYWIDKNVQPKNRHGHIKERNDIFVYLFCAGWYNC